MSGSSPSLILAERAAANPDEARAAAMAPTSTAEAGRPTTTRPSWTIITFHAAVASAQNRSSRSPLQTMGQIVSHHFVTTVDPEHSAMVYDDHRDLLASSPPVTPRGRGR